MDPGGDGARARSVDDAQTGSVFSKNRRSGCENPLAGEDTCVVGVRQQAVVHPEGNVLTFADDDDVVLRREARSSEIQTLATSDLSKDCLCCRLTADRAESELFRFHQAAARRFGLVVVQVGANRIRSAEDGSVDVVSPRNSDGRIPVAVDEVELLSFRRIVRILVGEISEGVSDFVDEDDVGFVADIDRANSTTASSAENVVVDEDDCEGAGGIGWSIRGHDENARAVASQDALSIRTVGAVENVVSCDAVASGSRFTRAGLNRRMEDREEVVVRKISSVRHGAHSCGGLLEKIQEALHIVVEFRLLRSGVTRGEENHVALVLCCADHLKCLDGDLGSVNCSCLRVSETSVRVLQRDGIDLVTAVRLVLVFAGEIDSFDVIDGCGENDGEVGVFLNFDVAVEVRFTVFRVRFIVVENAGIFDDDVALLTVVFFVSDEDGPLFVVNIVELLVISARRSGSVDQTSGEN